MARRVKEMFAEPKAICRDVSLGMEDAREEKQNGILIDGLID